MGTLNNHKLNITIKNNRLKNKPELLAPAGSFDALRTACINGADAVYVGLNDFSARASCENFSLESLKSAINYAHIFSCKVYVAINTLIKHEEMESAIKSAILAFEAGASAIIVQDLALITELKKRKPEIVLHGSTQMGIHNLHGVISASKIGLDRVILSRETPLSEIINISNNSDIEIEHFVHGALCCAFSGNCYFSSLVSGNSGNRGKCLQLCRKPYQLMDSNQREEGYFLSTKDTMHIDEIKALFNAGVCSFKIEGRMRRKEYVAEAVRVYRKAIDSLFEEGESVTREDKEALKLMFNRGDFSKAHLFGVDNRIIYPLLQSHKGLKIGNVKYISEGKAVLDCAVNKGDGIKFLRNGKEVGHALVISKGNSTGFLGRVIKGDEVFLTDSALKNREINERKARIPLAINAHFSLENTTARITLESKGRDKSFEYIINIEKAQKSPISTADIIDAITSLGETNFECSAVDISFDSPFFAQKSVLKQLKRNFIADFEQFLIDSFPHSLAINTTQFNPHNYKQLNTEGVFTIIMCDLTEVELYKEYADLIVLKPSDYSLLLSLIESGDFVVDSKKYLLDLPAISFSSDIELLTRIIDTKAFNRFVVNNIYGLNLVGDYEIILGYKMNLQNGLIDFAQLQSIETPLLEEFNSPKIFTYAFGKPDIMQFVHCYYNYARGCKQCFNPTSLYLKEEGGAMYELTRQKIINCYNLLSLSRPIDLMEKKIEKKFIDATRLTREEKDKLMTYLSLKKQAIT